MRDNSFYLVTYQFYVLTILLLLSQAKQYSKDAKHLSIKILQNRLLCLYG
jgi:hypothetical protein